MSQEFITFLVASVIIIVIPGPNVMLVVATSLSRGRRSGLQTVAGTSAAMLVQLLIAALATGVMVSSLALGLALLKWLGVIYLLYLGCNALFARRTVQASVDSPSRTFGRGFWVALTNPKTILFFAAFLPQFVSPERAYLPQVALLSLSFWLLAVVLDSSYAMLASLLGGRFRQLGRSGWLARASGLVYLGAASLLASTRQA